MALSAPRSEIIKLTKEGDRFSFFLNYTLGQRETILGIQILEPYNSIHLIFQTNPSLHLYIKIEKEILTSMLKSKIRRFR